MAKLRSTLPFLLLPVLHGLAAQEPATTAPAAPPAEALTFRWPVPATAIVTEKVRKRGRTAETRYRVEVVDGEHAGTLLVRLRDFEFVAIEGLDLEDPKVKEALAPQLALAKAIPDLSVGKDGGYRGVVDVDAMLERVLAVERARPGVDATKVEATVKRMRSPQARAAMETVGAGFWNCWAGHWTGHSIRAGSELAVAPGSLLPGVAFSNQATLRHHGEATGSPGCVRLSLQHEAGAEAVAALLAGMAPEVLRDPAAKAVLATARVRLSAEAVLDPATLQPRSAMYEKVITMTPPGEKQPVEQLERHEYTFVWQPKAR